MNKFGKLFFWWKRKIIKILTLNISYNHTKIRCIYKILFDQIILELYFKILFWYIMLGIIKLSSVTFTIVFKKR